MGVGVGELGGVLGSERIQILCLFCFYFTLIRGMRLESSLSNYIGSKLDFSVSMVQRGSFPNYR